MNSDMSGCPLKAVLERFGPAAVTSELELYL